MSSKQGAAQERARAGQGAPGAPCPSEPSTLRLPTPSSQLGHGGTCCLRDVPALAARAENHVCPRTHCSLPSPQPEPLARVPECVSPASALPYEPFSGAYMDSNRTPSFWGHGHVLLAEATSPQGSPTSPERRGGGELLSALFRREEL